jgi:drug/metabolite transporter (DMT)-like permease
MPGSHLKGIAYVAIGAVFISFSAVFVVWANVVPTISAFYRMFFGGIILLGLAYFRGKRIWAGGKPFLFVAICAFFISLDLVVWHASIHFIGPGLATIIANFQVFVLGLAGVLWYGERPTVRLWIAIPIALIGLFMLVGIEWDEAADAYKTGVWLSLLAAVSYGVYILFLRQSQLNKVRLSITANMAWISLSAALLMGLYAFWVEGSSFRIPDTQSWLALLGLGLFCQVLGWVSISSGLGKLDASKGGLILLLQPALAFIWDILFFGRPTGVWDVAGAVIALAAIYLGVTRKKSLPRPEDKQKA